MCSISNSYGLPEKNWDWSRLMSKRLIVLGSMGRIPYAGMAWETLHYQEGFRRLGHDVHYVEDTNCWPYDLEQETSTEDCKYAVNYIARTLEWAGLSHRWAYRAAEPDGRQIAAAFEAIHSDYAKHSRASRAIAEGYFRAETVLVKLLDDLGI